jgi:hypothetical protein
VTDSIVDTDGQAALRAACDRLLVRIQHWSAPRWSAPATTQPSNVDGYAVEVPETGISETSVAEAGIPRTRADVVFELVRVLANACAEAESRPPVPVPRLENDLALPDQLRVMVNDLAGAPESVTCAAAKQVLAALTAL